MYQNIDITVAWTQGWFRYCLSWSSSIVLRVLRDVEAEPQVGVAAWVHGLILLTLKRVIWLLIVYRCAQCRCSDSGGCICIILDVAEGRIVYLAFMFDCGTAGRHTLIHCASCSWAHQQMALLAVLTRLGQARLQVVDRCHPLVIEASPSAAHYGRLMAGRPARTGGGKSVCSAAVCTLWIVHQASSLRSLRLKWLLMNVDSWRHKLTARSSRWGNASMGWEVVLPHRGRMEGGAGARWRSLAYFGISRCWYDSSTLKSAFQRLLLLADRWSDALVSLFSVALLLFVIPVKELDKLLLHLGKATSISCWACKPWVTNSSRLIHPKPMRTSPQFALSFHRLINLRLHPIYLMDNASILLQFTWFVDLPDPIYGFEIWAKRRYVSHVRGQLPLRNVP